MIVANLTGAKAKLSLKESLDEIADWAASKPADNDVIYSTYTKSWWIYNREDGAVNIGMGVDKVEYNTTPPATTLVDPDLINRTILYFGRDGIGKQIVSGTPTGSNQVQFDYTTGTFTLFAGDVFGYEWVQIIFSYTPPPSISV